jgi:cytochrome c oxidase subunit 2
VFLALGTLVGIVVISYTLYNAYKYRYREGEDPAPEADRPELGELPSGGGKGKKLFLSFSLSAIIVVSLVVWTYGLLLYVENKPTEYVQNNANADAMTIDVVGFQFGWRFTYPNGHTTSGELRVPKNRMVMLNVTSTDVFHNFGIPEMKVKTDAIPGQTTETWFVPKQTGNYTAQCYELCGAGHSYMDAQVRVMERNEYSEWYQSTNGTSNGTQAGVTP